MLSTSVITETSISPLQKQRTPGHCFPRHETQDTHFACLVYNTTKNSTCCLTSPSVHQHCLPAHPLSDLEASWVFFLRFEMQINLCDLWSWTEYLFFQKRSIPWRDSMKRVPGPTALGYSIDTDKVSARMRTWFSTSQPNKITNHPEPKVLQELRTYIVCCCYCYLFCFL